MAASSPAAKPKPLIGDTKAAGDAMMIKEGSVAEIGQKDEGGKDPAGVPDEACGEEQADSGESGWQTARSGGAVVRLAEEAGVVRAACRASAATVERPTKGNLFSMLTGDDTSDDESTDESTDERQVDAPRDGPVPTKLGGVDDCHEGEARVLSSRVPHLSLSVAGATAVRLCMGFGARTGTATLGGGSDDVDVSPAAESAAANSCAATSGEEPDEGLEQIFDALIERSLELRVLSQREADMLTDRLATLDDANELRAMLRGYEAERGRLAALPVRELRRRCEQRGVVQEGLLEKDEFVYALLANEMVNPSGRKKNKGKKKGKGGGRGGGGYSRGGSGGGAHEE